MSGNTDEFSLASLSPLPPPPPCLTADETTSDAGSRKKKLRLKTEHRVELRLKTEHRVEPRVKTQLHEVDKTTEKRERNKIASAALRLRKKQQEETMVAHVQRLQEELCQRKEELRQHQVDLANVHDKLRHEKQLVFQLQSQLLAARSSPPAHDGGATRAAFPGVAKVTIAPSIFSPSSRTSHSALYTPHAFSSGGYAATSPASSQFSLSSQFSSSSSHSVLSPLAQGRAAPEHQIAWADPLWNPEDGDYVDADYADGDDCGVQEDDDDDIVTAGAAVAAAVAAAAIGCDAL